MDIVFSSKETFHISGAACTHFRIPAKIASFDDVFIAVAKQDVRLPCIAVGSPSPQLHWKMRGEPIPKNDRIRQLPDGGLQIARASKADSGKYT